MFEHINACTRTLYNCKTDANRIIPISICVVRLIFYVLVVFYSMQSLWLCLCSTTKRKLKRQAEKKIRVTNGLMGYAMYEFGSFFPCCNKNSERKWFNYFAKLHFPLFSTFFFFIFSFSFTVAT